MLSKSDVRRLIEYSDWANDRTLDACAALSRDDFVRDMATSYGSVRGTLVHVLSAEWLWLERFEGRGATAMLPEGDFPDIAALRARWRQLQADRWRWFDGVDHDALAADIGYQDTRGTPHSSPLWQLVQHVANHSTYHRGQITTLLRQLGAEPVSTDMHAWDRGRR